MSTSSMNKFIRFFHETSSTVSEEGILQGGKRGGRENELKAGATPNFLLVTY